MKGRGTARAQSPMPGIVKQRLDAAIHARDSPSDLKCRVTPISDLIAPMTTLGTPLSPSATRAMLLGSGELGKEVLIALQRLGVETIAVDRYENAPGQQVAHHAHTITMS